MSAVQRRERRDLGGLLLVGFLLGAGCGPPRLVMRGEPAPELLERDTRLLGLVSALRGLPLRRDVAIRYHTDEKKSGAGRSPPPGPGTSPAAPSRSGGDDKPIRDAIFNEILPVWIAFGMVSPRFDRSDSGRLVGQVRSAIAARYSDEERTIFVRIAASEEERDLAVAHELDHALTDQHFGLEHLRRIDEFDAALAARAVAEGDAELTSLLWMGLRDGKERAAPLEPVDRDAARQADRVLVDKQLGELPSAVRELVAFPYLAGLRFAWAIHQAGGFERVNRLYTELPESTEQVLHPQKYLDGERPVPVPRPPLPPGAKVLGVGTLGELGIRAMLDRCLPQALARSAAEGWGGDRYLVFQGERSSGLPRLLWATVWDDEREAVEFVRAMNDYAQPSCHERAFKEPELPPFVVARQGVRVVVARGLDDATTRIAIAAMMAARVTVPPRRPPLGR